MLKDQCGHAKRNQKQFKGVSVSKIWDNLTTKKNRNKELKNPINM